MKTQVTHNGTVVKLSVSHERDWTWIDFNGSSDYVQSSESFRNLLKEANLRFSRKRTAWYAMKLIDIESLLESIDEPTPKKVVKSTPKKTMQAKTVSVRKVKPATTQESSLVTIQNPSDYTIAEFKTLLESTQPSNDVIIEMYSLEEAGKNRKSMKVLLETFAPLSIPELPSQAEMAERLEQTWEPIVQVAQSTPEIEERLAKVESKLDTVQQLLVQLAQSQQVISKLVASL